MSSARVLANALIRGTRSRRSILISMTGKSPCEKERPPSSGFSTGSCEIRTPIYDRIGSVELSLVDDVSSTKFKTD